MVQAIYNALLGVVFSLATALLAALIIYEKRIRTRHSQGTQISTIKHAQQRGATSSQFIGKCLRIVSIVNVLLCMTSIGSDFVYYNDVIESDFQCSLRRNLAGENCFLSVLKSKSYPGRSRTGTVRDHTTAVSEHIYS